MVRDSGRRSKPLSLTVLQLYRTRNEVATMSLDEAAWRSNVRDACADAACLNEVYEKQIQQLRSVAYDDNRSFPASDLFPSIYL